MKLFFNFFFSLAVLLSARDNYGVNTRNQVINNFKTDISNPLTAGGDFKTRDGKKSFKANVSCSDEVRPFTQISYTGTSDISISVSIDENLDGVPDNSFTISGVSGVGTNGIIKCDVNSWNNCKYYKYQYSGRILTLVSTDRKYIGGAYCINSSCNSPSQNQKKSILEDIGSGISTVISNSYKNYIITKYDNDGNNIVYYAQNPNGCKNLSGNVYSGGESGISSSTDSLKLDSNGTYSVLLSGADNSVINKPAATEFNDLKIRAPEKQTAKFDRTTQLFTYTGKRKADKKSGTWIAEANNAQFNIDLNDTNVKFCQVKWDSKSNEVFSDGSNRSATISGELVKKFDIRECIGDDFMQCPYDASKGEVVQFGCGEVDNFSEVVSSLSAVDEMAKDFTCSMK